MAESDSGLTPEEIEEIKELLGAPDKDYNKPLRKTGGLIIPTCSRCGNPLRQTTGGVIMEYCPSCGQYHQEPKY